MIIWLDAQLPPSVAAWITATFDAEARAVRDLGLRDAQDSPKVLWVTCGNTSNARLCKILSSALPAAIARLQGGESLVEIGDVVA